MNSVRLTRSLAPKIIADVATMLADILLLWEPPHSPLATIGIRRTRYVRRERALRHLAEHPRFTERSRKVLERGFQEVSRQAERIQMATRKQMQKITSPLSPECIEEALRESETSAQELLLRVRQIQTHLKGYFATIATGQDYYVDDAERGGVTTIPLGPMPANTPAAIDYPAGAHPAPHAGW